MNQNETTRYLCASAFLSGASFRDAILRRQKDHHQAACPELGVNMSLVASVCKYADRRAVRFHIYFVAIAVFAIGAPAVFGQPMSVVVDAVLVLASTILYFIKSYQERYNLVVPFLKQNFDEASALAKFSQGAARPQREPSLREDENLIIYSGFSPFVGAGLDFGGWSFAVSTIKPVEDAFASSAIKNFTVAELYSEVQEGMRSLAVESMMTDDFFFVRGDEIREDREILQHHFARPSQTVGPNSAAKYINSCDVRVRHYKWLQVRDWGGELIMSMFFRCTLRGSNLFVEMNRFLLTPLKEEYHRVDRISPPGATTFISLLLVSLIVGQFYVIWSALFMLGRVSEKVAEAFGGEERKIRKEIKENPHYNYGVGKSLRTELGSNQYQHYFQKLDSDFYSKILERQILDSIVVFLDDHGIDTSEIKERKRTILNSGIIVQGGNVNAESLAVGIGAKAVKAGFAAIRKSTEKEAA